jgi:hypothetical protein
VHEKNDVAQFPLLSTKSRPATILEQITVNAEIEIRRVRELTSS